ncbi:MAG: methyltransferase [Microbacteriaceae bacterium]
MQPAALNRLREDLLRSSYTAEQFEAFVAADARDALRRGIVFPAQRELADREHAGQIDAATLTLMRLFALGLDVSRTEASEAFSSLGLEGAETLGLVSTGRNDSTVRAAVSLTPFGSWFILSDLDDHLRQAEARPDHVMGVGGATRSLIEAIPHHAVASALEIGTGCGVVALIVAQHADQVVATDVSERAIMFARANAVLNEVENIEVRLGDLFDPVAGETFDLVVTNPPFVISPQHTDAEKQFVYRSSNEPGDRLLRRLLAEVPAVLNEGACLVTLANWEFVWGSEDGEQALASLVPEAGDTCSAWLIERGRQTPLEYASLWLRDGGLREHETRYHTRLSEWIADLTSRNVSRVCFGYVMLRKVASGERAFVHAERVAGQLGGETHFGSAWSAAFAEHAAATQLSDDALLDKHYSLCDGVEEVRTLVPGTEEITSISFVLRDGIERFESVDTFTSAMLGACDGDLTLGEIAGALAELLDVATDDARLEAARVARDFIARGLLEDSAPQHQLELT